MLEFGEENRTHSKPPEFRMPLILSHRISVGHLCRGGDNSWATAVPTDLI